MCLFIYFYLKPHDILISFFIRRAMISTEKKTNTKADKGHFDVFREFLIGKVLNQIELSPKR